MLEFCYSEDGQVYDGSPISGLYRKGDWWLDGQRMETGDVVAWTTDKGVYEMSVNPADYGYVVLMLLAHEGDDEFTYELTKSDAGPLNLSWVRRWHEGLTVEDLQANLKEIEDQIALTRAREEEIESGDPSEWENEWEDVMLAHSVEYLEHLQAIHRERLAEMGVPA